MGDALLHRCQAQGEHRRKLLDEVWAVCSGLQLAYDSLDDVVVDALEVDLGYAFGIGHVDTGRGRR